MKRSASKDPIDHLSADKARLLLKEIRAALFPEENYDNEWSSDEVEIIGNLINPLLLPSVKCKECESRMSYRWPKNPEHPLCDECEVGV